MTPINKTVDTTNKMLDNQTRRYYKHNIRRMESKPIFCTYFNQSRADSMVSKGLGMVYEKAGENSPLRFNKINNVPIYAFKEFNRETRKSEYKGINVELNNEGLIPSSTFTPLTGDFLIIHLGKEDVLFEVSVSDPNTVLEEPHYRIQYSYGAVRSKDEQSFKDIEMHIIGEYDYILTNVGENKATVLDIKTVDTIRSLVASYARLNKAYLNEFYDDGLNVLVYKYMCYDNPEHPVLMNYYSPMLVEFQRRVRPIMYEFTSVYTQELILTHETMGFFEFEKTIYGDLCNDEILNYRGFNYFDITKFEEGGAYLELMKTFPPPRYLSVLNQFYKEGECVMQLVFPSDKMIVNYIQKQFNSKEKITEQVVEKFKEVHRKVLDPYSPIIKTICEVVKNPNELISSTKDYVVKNTVEDFLYVPVLLYILKITIEGLQRNPKFLLDEIPEVK